MDGDVLVHGEVERAGAAEGEAQRRPLDAHLPVDDHLAPRLVVDGVDGGQAVAGRQHAVVRVRRAAPLHVPEGDDPRVEAGPLLDGRGDDVGDPTQLGVPVAVERAARGAPSSPPAARPPPPPRRSTRSGHGGGGAGGWCRPRRCRRAARAPGSRSLPRRCRRRWRSSPRAAPSPRPPSRGRGTPPSCGGGRWRRWRSGPRCGSRRSPRCRGCRCRWSWARRRWAGRAGRAGGRPRSGCRSPRRR